VTPSFSLWQISHQPEVDPVAIPFLPLFLLSVHHAPVGRLRMLVEVVVCLVVDPRIPTPLILPSYSPKAIVFQQFARLGKLFPALLDPPTERYSYSATNLPLVVVPNAFTCKMQNLFLLFSLFLSVLDSPFPFLLLHPVYFAV